jgi:PAS domain S-box-containing protein
MEKLQRGEKVEHFETTRIRKDGMHIHVSLTVSSVKDASGRIVGYSVIARDITESKKAEERFSKAFNASPEPITIANFSEGRYIDVNESFLRVTGYRREEVIGRTSLELKFWERPEDRVRLVEALKRQGSVRDLEITFLTKSGEQRTGMDSAEVIEIAGQKCVLAVFKDVTEKKNLEQQLRHAQKLEAIGGLAAGMAHEINTPIQFVGDNARFLQDSFHGIADLIDRYEELCEEADQGAVRPELLERARTAREKADWAYLRTEVPKALEQMLDGVGRVATIVRAMKEFSHVDQSVEKTAADLNKALESTLVVARNELKFVAEVETHYGELPLVMCHLGDLNQVFLNLLVNAAHAIGDAVKGTGEKGRIGVRTKQEEEWVEIAISDTGTGVPERIRERIFDPFFTTKEVGKGSGQGLALARAIVMEKHGGTLTFETEMGKGTTFYVRLPVNSAREAKELVAR